MSTYLEKWNALNVRVKTGLVIGTVLIGALTIGLAVWAYGSDYQILFADITAADAASMTAELDRMKVPYQLSDGGNTILVPKDLVYKTRLKLMGKELPLRGAVGFEVFNNADFGMTEFVQKVNYQRAVQGELTRTILSVDDIQSARVHLAIPEQGLFKKTATKPKASVTLVMKPGHVLAPEQTLGIQRLVAASIPDMVSADVTVLDQHGVVLNRNSSSEPESSNNVAQLEFKKSTEDYLTRKVAHVLDKTFGPGEAIATVDVSLNLDQSRLTLEDVVPAKAIAGQAGSPTGVMVRERQTLKESGTASATAASKEPQPATVTSSESDYQVGRRVEQIISTPGTTKRMTIAVVVKRPLNDTQLDKLKEIVGLAVGFNSQRGDAIVVSSMNRLFTTETGVPIGAAQGGHTISEDAIKQMPSGATIKERDGLIRLPHAAWLMIPVLIVGGIGALAMTRRNQRKKEAVASQVAHLDREQVLRDIQQWIEGPAKNDTLAEIYK